MAVKGLSAMKTNGLTKLFPPEKTMAYEEEPSLEQIAHNTSLWHWYPLGQTDAIWSLVELLHRQLGPRYDKDLEGLLRP